MSNFKTSSLMAGAALLALAASPAFAQVAGTVSSTTGAAIGAAPAATIPPINSGVTTNNAGTIGGNTKVGLPQSSSDANTSLTAGTEAQGNINASGATATPPANATVGAKAAATVDPNAQSSMSGQTNAAAGTPAASASSSTGMDASAMASDTSTKWSSHVSKKTRAKVEAKERSITDDLNARALTQAQVRG